MDQLFMQLYVLLLIIKNIFVRIMIPRMPSFRDYDFQNFTELSVDVQDSKFFTQSPLNHKVIVDPTALSEHENIEDFHFSKSYNNTVRDYEISFQADFMKEHENAFKIQTENFIESSFKLNDDRTITYQSEGIFGENLQWGTFSEDEESLLRFEQNVQFFKNIQNQQKLIQFLQFVYKTVPKEFAAEFVYLASIAWTKHSTNKEIYQQSEFSIVQKAKKLSSEEFQKLFEDQRIKFLNFKIVSNSQLNSQILVKDAFKTYIQFFFATVLLVGQEFFENPYGDYAKRNRTLRFEEDLEENDPSSADSIELGMPTKKLHFY